MVIYYVLMKIRLGAHAYVEITNEIELPFHPNKSDEISCFDFPCVVERIHYDIEDPSPMIYLTAIDNLPVYYSKQEARRWLYQEWGEIKGIYPNAALNDYHNGFLKEFEEYENESMDSSGRNKPV